MLTVPLMQDAGAGKQLTVIKINHALIKTVLTTATIHLTIGKTILTSTKTVLTITKTNTSPSKNQQKMTARQEAKLNMYGAVITHCDAYPLIVALIPAFEAAYTAFKAKNDALVVKKNLQAQPITGVTQDKANARKTLEEATVVVAAKAFAWAVNTNNMELKEQFNYTASGLQGIRDGELDGVCQNIHDKVDANAAALVSYGIIPDDITALQDLIDAYKGKVSSPRNKINNRSAAKDDLVTLFKEADTILKLQMDKLATGFKGANADFYNVYVQSRVIVDAPTNSEEVPAPPSA